MTYLLDTNICIYGMKGLHQSVTDKLLSVHPDEITVSSVTISELEYGAAKSNWSDRTRMKFIEFLSSFHVLDYTAKDARIYGPIREELERRGTPIGAYDLMIAAQAISNNLILVTHNTKEFSRIQGLRLEDWVE